MHARKISHLAKPIIGLAIATLLVAWITASGTNVAGAAPSLNNGVGTQAALNADNCDKATGNIKFPYTGRPPCVKPWKDGDNNGGATAPGVTKDSIKVVVRKQTDAVINAGSAPPKDRATGAVASIQDSFRDTAKVFEQVYQTWGRKLAFEFIDASGTDEAAQRADAVSALAKKPFAVIDLAAGDIFQTAVAAGKVLSLSPTTGTVQQSITQSPYRWTASQDQSATAVLGAEFIGKALNNQPAQYAGDASLKNKKRAFAIVRSAAPNAPAIEYVMSELGKYKVKIAQDLTYTPPTDTSQSRAVADQNAPTMIAKLKDSGVTSVIVLADSTMVGALTRAATSNDYHPEWIAMGYGFIDIAFLSRSFDQDQWAHAFGVLALYPPVRGVTSGPSDLTFQWYWGPNKGVYVQSVFSQLEILYPGIQIAGPKLTAENFKLGMFSRTPVGGIAEGQRTTTGRFYGKQAKLPYDEYMVGGDVTLAWWDKDSAGPSISVPGADAKGVWQFVDEAKRYAKSELPTKAPAFFDKTGAVFVFEALPPKDVQISYPCTGCPRGIS